MRLAMAEKVCPAARFVPAQEDRYRAVHEVLVSAADSFTPIVEADGLGLLYADVSGLGRRFASDADLGREMAAEASRVSGLGVRVGVAGARFVALQAAHAAQPGGGCVVPAGEERAFLSPLPLSVLSADPEMQRRLQLLGVRTLGALGSLPRPAIVRQFGAHAGPLHDLARGVDPRPVRAGAPPLQIERVHVFDVSVVDRSRLLACLDGMVAELAEALAARSCQAEGLRLQLEDERGDRCIAGAPIKPPSADGAAFARLAHRLLGRLEPGASVIGVTLGVYPLRPYHLGATQLALFVSRPDVRREKLREVLRRLRERFGEMIVVVASLVGPPPPRPIQVTTGAHGLPCALVWADRIQEVQAVYETWRERIRWWSRPVERDYYRLETRDGQVWIVFQDLRTGRWLLERRRI
jgi:DNA polymerase-4